MKKIYKTELHCHTGDSSSCGQCSAEYILSRYLESGYSTLVVTDHFNRNNLFRSNNYLKYITENDMKTSWQTRMDYFLQGYKNLKKISEGKMNILLGMEFMSWVDGNKNDYLIFGITEDWIRASEFIPKFTYEEMAIYAHEFGMKIYQAHPFRKRMMISDPSLLDGIEIYNGTVNVQSNNSMAEVWADHTGMKKISGSDFHETIHKTCAGILTEEPIETNEQLLKVLDSQDNYELIRDIKELM